MRSERVMKLNAMAAERGIQRVSGLQILQQQRLDRQHIKYPPGSTHKRCTVCRLNRPLDAFSELKTGALGRQARCKDCICQIGRAYTRRTREAKAQRFRPERCDCCDSVPTMARLMHYDHNHSTGAFRGWLCHNCNSALANVKDSIQRLEMLIAYLKRSRDHIATSG